MRITEVTATRVGGARFQRPVGPSSGVTGDGRLVLGREDRIAICRGLQALGPYARAYAEQKGLAIVDEASFRDRLLHLGEEYGELVAACRAAPDKPAEHLGEDFTAVEEEAAEMLLLVVLIAGAKRWRLDAVIPMIERFSESRAFKHGKEW